MAATTETQMANNFDHQLRIGSPVKKYMQESYDSPEVMNSAPMRPVSSRPTRTASRASFSEDMPTNTQARRPKTTHVSSGRRRWRSPPNVQDPYETQEFENSAQAPPAPARPASSRPARIQSRALKEDLSPDDEIDVPIPSSPKIRPTTHIYRKPGQQFHNEDVEDIVERARSRAASRAQDIVEESPREAEVRGQNIANNNNSYSPSRKYSVDDNIQPKIGHYYSRSPSPQQQIQLPRRPMTSRNASRSQNNAMTQSYEDLENRRPMTSRSASRNAMTQVDDDLRSRHDRSSPPPRGFIEISGRESRAASRADTQMRHSMTAPNLNGHAVQSNDNYKGQENGRKMGPSYSRHYEYDYNGHRIPRANFNNNNQANDEQFPNRGNLKPSTSLSLLPLSRDANDLSFNNKYNRPGSDWNLTTTKRAFRYSEEGFKQARAKPYKPTPSLKIAVEGKRYMNPEKKDVYVRFASARPSRSARPEHERSSPATPNSMLQYVPQHIQYDNDQIDQVVKDAPEAGYGRAETGYRKEPMVRNHETSRRRDSLSVLPDARFAQGTTTKSTFKELPSDGLSSVTLSRSSSQHRFGHFHAEKSLPRPMSSTRSSFRGHGKEAFSEDYRPKAILPKHNLGVDDDSNHTAARNEPPTRPTSAMSEDFKPHGQDAFSEKWRPRPVIPPTTLRMEGIMTRKTTSTEEHFPAKPYSRLQPTPIKSSLSVSKENIAVSRETTYRKDSATVLGSPLKRALRYDSIFKRPDSIDWM